MDLQQIKKGLVIRDYVDEIANPKIKMGVLLGINPSTEKLKFVLINSRMTDKARSTPALRDRHVAISPSSYSCLDRVSYIDCTQVVSRSLTTLKERIDRNRESVCGMLLPEDLAKVVNEVGRAVTVKPKDKKLITSEFRLPPIVKYR